MTTDPTRPLSEERTPLWLLAVAWAAVLLPLAWGVAMTLMGALKLFTGASQTSPP